jgi:ABC-type dipeptide/oligopeptide/nickel transport system ATPase component
MASILFLELVCRHAFLIADEPTSELEVRSRFRSWSTIARLILRVFRPTRREILCNTTGRRADA